MKFRPLFNFFLSHGVSASKTSPNSSSGIEKRVLDAIVPYHNYIAI